MPTNRDHQATKGPTALISTLRNLQDEDIIQLVGFTTHAQGQHSYLRGDVLETEFNAEQTEAIVQVRGATTQYTCWISQPGQTSRELDMRCTCRTGTYCKHNAAALYELRSNLSATGTSWREMLLPLLTPLNEGTELALVINVSDPDLPITPRRLQGGRWTSRRASWADLTSTRWASISEGIRVDHLAFIRDFWQTAKAKSRWSSPNRVELGMLGKDAYAVLARAKQIGISLFASTDPEVELELSDSLAALIAQRADIDEDLELSIVASIGGKRTTNFKLIEPANLVLFDDRKLAQLGPGQRELIRLARTRRRILVPARDRVDFLVNFAPRLTQVDADTEDLGTATLKGRVDLQGNYAHITWSAEFRSGDASIEMPIRDARTRNAKGGPELDRTIETVCKRLDAVIDQKEPGKMATVYMPDIPEFLTAAYELESKLSNLRWDFAESVENLSFSSEPVELAVEAIDSDDPDWFNLRVKIQVGENELAVEDVMKAVAEGKLWVQDASGAWIEIPIELFEKFELILSEATEDPVSGVISIPGSRVGVIQNLEDINVGVSGDSKWLARLREAIEPPAIEGLPKPPGAELREYQESGVAWMNHLTSLGFGALLADDMGLGKTLQVLSLLDWKKSSGHLDRGALVVAPTSVVSTWVSEAKRFYPHLAVEVVEGTSKTRPRTVAEILADNDIVITSWALLRLDADEYSRLELDGAVFDEAQAIKNVATHQSRAARLLKADWKIAATGTPVENTVSDLWSIMETINPGVFPKYQVFNQQFKRPIESGSDPAALERLQKIAAPFIRRRTKEMVAPDLPPKIEQLLSVSLDDEHRKFYDNYLNRMRNQLLELLDAPKKNATNILAALTRLRQLSLDPGLVDPERPWPIPAKTQLLIEHLETLTSRGHQVLVFSQFTSYLRRLLYAIQRNGISTSYLDGTTRDREAVIEEFRSGRTSVFLISLKAGGTGLTLTEADYVYVMDPWWNPAVENQAIDRAHRIGQDKTVNVYRLCAANTIEEKVIALQEHKRQIIDDVVSVPALSAQDLADLLK